MKNTGSRAIWGILFILLGLGFAGKAFGLFDFNIFFRGWWTFFIIIPCAFGLSASKKRTSSIIGLGIGILLFLSAQGIFQWYMFARLLIAFIFLVIGGSLILRGNQKKDYFDYNEGSNNESMNYESSNNESMNYQSSNNESTNSESNNYENNNYENRSYEGTNHDGYNHFTGILSGQNVQFIDEVFTGATICSILGNVQLDLRNAIFNGNVVVETTCILGGVDFFVPANLKVVNNCTVILAGVDNNVITPFNTSGEMHTLFINGTCILGGIEVK